MPVIIYVLLFTLWFAAIFRTSLLWSFQTEEAPRRKAGTRLLFMTVLFSFLGMVLVNFPKNDFLCAAALFVGVTSGVNCIIGSLGETSPKKIKMPV